MANFSILRRLIWQAWRQGWAMLALGVILPPCASMLRQIMSPMPAANTPWTITVFLLFVMIAVWAATLAEGAGERRSYANLHFPIHPALASMMTFILYSGIALLIGIWIGWWQWHTLAAFASQALQIIWSQGAVGILPWFSRVAGVECLLLIVGAGFAVAVFSLSYVVALSCSRWAGMVSAIIWGLVFNRWSVELLTSTHADMQYIWLADALLRNGMVIIAGVLGLLFLHFPRTASRRGRVVTLSLLGITALFFPILSVAHSTLSPTPNSLPPSRLATPDGASAVEVVFSRSEGLVELRLVDYRRELSAVQRFKRRIHPMAFVDASTVLLLQQSPEARDLSLLEWSLEDNQLRRLLTIPSSRNTLNRFIGTYFTRNDRRVALSPDGRQMVIALPSPYGDYDFVHDLWWFDLHQRQATLARPLAASGRLEISWTANGALVSRQGDSLLCITAPGRVEELPLSLTEEVR
jgi:hypothetical protein